MGKGARNRAIRRLVAEKFPSHDRRSIARALRRHGRMPHLKSKEQR